VGRWKSFKEALQLIRLGFQSDPAQLANEIDHLIRLAFLSTHFNAIVLPIRMESYGRKLVTA
jgi:hypothetical protein